MTSKRTKLVSLSYAGVEAVTFRRSVMSRVCWEGHYSMLSLQKWRNLGITWYVLALFTRWSAYAHGEQGPTHRFPGLERKGLSPTVLSLHITLGIERGLRTQDRLCHSRKDICTLVPFRSIPVPETDHVDSHRTPGYLYDKPNPLRLITKGDDGLRVLRGRPLPLVGH
jgi:hypothetical protein